MCNTKTIFIVFQIMFCFMLLKPVKSMKYDVESEAIKLYGENLNTVLLRFRKTPDYVEILKDKMLDTQATIEEIGTKVLLYYTEKMKQQLNEKFGVDKNPVSDKPSTIMSSHSFRAMNTIQRRQLPDGGKKKEPTPVEELERYPFFNTHLTVSERNTFKDLGFHYIGLVIKSIIKNSVPEGDPDDSGETTRSPFIFDDQDIKKPWSSTTTRHRDHETQWDAKPYTNMSKVPSYTVGPGDENGDKFQYRHHALGLGGAIGKIERDRWASD